MNAHAKYIFIDGTFMPTQPSHNQMITQERHVQKQNRRSPWQNLYARRICTHRFMVRFQSVQGVALKKRLQSRDESGTFVNSSNGTHFSPKSLSDRLSRRNDWLIPAWTSQVMVYVNDAAAGLWLRWVQATQHCQRLVAAGVRRWKTLSGMGQGWCSMKR